MFPATLRRHRGNSAFHDLQQCLLDALARNITRNRRIVRLARDFVDFVNIDDAALGAFDVVVCSLQQLKNDVLDVFTDITGFGQCRGIRHGEGNIKNPCQGLGQKRFTATGRSHQHDIGFCQFDIFVLAGVMQTLVMVVNRDRENFFRMALTNDIVIKDLANLLRRRHPVSRFDEMGFVLFADDVHAKLYAFITDEYGWTGDELANLVLALSTERTVQSVLGVPAIRFAHTNPNYV